MKAVFIFAGQGSQALGMAKDFYENCSQAKELLQNASDHCKIDFKHLLFEPNEDLNKSEFTQPAIVLSSLMAYLAFKERLDLECECALGHSLGEISALCVQGGINFLDALFLVRNRALFMQEDCDKIEAGMLVVLGLSDEQVEQICQEALAKNKQIYAANYNCDGQIVVAGMKAHLQAYEAEFKKAGAKRAMLLNMSVASHCPLLKEASMKFKALLENSLSSSFKPVISNANAKPYTSKSEALGLLSEQLIKPVLYKQSIKNVEVNTDFFVEFSSAILKGLNKKNTSKETYSFTNLNELDEIIKVIGR
ncbi:ACP S-malonyltransferase [Campylobacter sp. MIT 97-5078]|uniref:ACP S-malonyltransferase n=1 Tax=Campylobacter sp. MIT 97-5078 TaxID=1548153 RepID=UPI0005130EEE|nr:ACP S-malonyltransferase [Campylobacter sp. MIT 97-5078]KGI56510.1 malonyl CoA-ACP transacylase [Campylobacter sp. MIT 97-5078]TQR27038.1 [acyl-carrier-protein] S-malonyltransferase [Campylobacter sp. MIT 97-5078]